MMEVEWKRREGEDMCERVKWNEINDGGRFTESMIGMHRIYSQSV